MSRSPGLNDLESSPVATTPTPQTSSWAEPAIESACRRAEERYRSLPAFEPRVFVGSGEVRRERAAPSVALEFGKPETLQGGWSTTCALDS